MVQCEVTIDQGDRFVNTGQLITGHRLDHRSIEAVIVKTDLQIIRADSAEISDEINLILFEI
jgi:hypothetical protein